ncbi:MAG TPA: protein kinase [Pseudomonadota bacterium]|nr:protein kinase [Pseudomonadota bacterium]
MELTDVKPANIMLQRGADGVAHAVVMDFGLAREAGDSQGLTESGAVMGTPAYMAPEQARGDKRQMDRRTDVYGLGATLYALLAGRPPFLDETPAATMVRVLSEDPTLLRNINPALPSALETIVSKCLNKEPAQRYPSALALAEDLERFLRQQQIVGRRTSLWYRLRWRARQNKVLTAALAALVLSLLALSGYGLRTRVQTLRQQERARHQAALAQTLGQSVERLEWLVRATYTLPLHNVEPELAEVRAKLGVLEAGLASYGELGQPLAHYALGRGLLALHEWERAHRHLKQAEALGMSDPELDYALGRALGEMFNQGLADARRSGERSYVEKQRRQLEQNLLVPARAYLQRSRGKTTASSSFVEAQLDRYSGHLDAALLHASFALRQTPWLYEAAKLQGDILLGQALDARDDAQLDAARHLFGRSIAQFEAAADRGRSDPQIYEELVEAWLRREELELHQGVDPTPFLAEAVSTAHRASEASPSRSTSHTRLAYAYFFCAIYQIVTPQNKSADCAKFGIIAGQTAIKLNPNEAFTHDALGNLFTILASKETRAGSDPTQLLAKSRIYFNKAIQINPNFAWAYNDLAIAYHNQAEYNLITGEETTEILSLANQLLNSAQRIDPEYENAIVNRMYNNSLMAQQKIRSGLDPREQHAHVVSLSKITKINYAQALCGDLSLANARHQLYSGRDPSSPTDEAISHYLQFSKTLSAGDIADCTLSPSLGNAHLIHAIYALRQGLAMDSHIQKGLAAATRCHSDPPSWDAVAYQSLLYALQAVSQSKRGAPFMPSLRQSIEAAAKVEDHLTENMDPRLAVAEAWLRVVELQHSHRMPIRTEVTRALAFLAKLLQRTKRWPHALAIESQLQYFQAKSATMRAEQQAAIKQAKDSMLSATKGNPLLGKYYAVEFARVDKLADELAR